MQSQTKLSMTIMSKIRPAFTLFALCARRLNANNYQSEFCPTLLADFNRRQLTTFGSSIPYTIADGGDGDAKAKHIPFLKVSEDGASFSVVVGNGDEENGVWHPMVASDDSNVVHFVSHMYVKDQDDNIVFIQSMDPTSGTPASISAAVPAGVTQLTPYEFCNLHGLWMGDTVMVNATESSDRSNSCGVETSNQWTEAAWVSLNADFERQQSLSFGSNVAFTESDSMKHAPFITLNGNGTASILVGSHDSEIHPMTGSTDGVEEPHWITEIYVVDNQDKIIALKTLDTTGVDVATMQFNVPDEATSLTAYVWCNIHGLYAGPNVILTTSTGSTSNTEQATGLPANAAEQTASCYLILSLLLASVTLL